MKIHTSLLAAILVLAVQVLSVAQTNQNAVAVVGDIYGVHCTGYAYQESQDYLVDWGAATEHDDSFIFWQNGVGGSAYVESIYELGVPNILMWETTSWPAGFWPNPQPPGTFTQFWYGIYPQTNAITHSTVGGGVNGAQINATATSPLTGSSFTENNLTPMTLTTGGAASSTAKNLFEISASAQTQTNAEPPNTDHVPWLPYSPFVPVPYDQISVDSFGQLDSEGKAYAVLPDNKDVIATAHIKGHDKNTYRLTPAKYTLTSYTLHLALTNTNRNRTTLGVGEEVSLSGMPASAIWNASAGGLSVTNGSSTLFTAPSNAAIVSVVAMVKNVSLAMIFDVVEPGGYDAKIITTNHYSAGTVGVGMKDLLHIHPTDVSFYRVTLAEDTNSVETRTGYFSNHTNVIVNTLVGSADLDDNNSFTDETAVGPFYFLPQPWYLGGLENTIPVYWQITGSSSNNFYGNFTTTTLLLDSSGNMNRSKFGITITRSTNDVSYSSQ